MIDIDKSDQKKDENTISIGLRKFGETTYVIAYKKNSKPGSLDITIIGRAGVQKMKKEDKPNGK